MVLHVAGGEVGGAFLPSNSSNSIAGDLPSVFDQHVEAAAVRHADDDLDARATGDADQFVHRDDGDSPPSSEKRF